jgi:hypothetical protein
VHVHMGMQVCVCVFVNMPYGTVQICAIKWLDSDK